MVDKDRRGRRNGRRWKKSLPTSILDALAQIGARGDPVLGRIKWHGSSGHRSLGVCSPANTVAAPRSGGRGTAGVGGSGSAASAGRIGRTSAVRVGPMLRNTNDEADIAGGSRAEQLDGNDIAVSPRPDPALFTRVECIITGAADAQA
jgi:hypothetical protein